MQWISIGRGSDRSQLEDIIATLQEQWKQRYKYRIKIDKEDLKKPYQLQVKHS